MLDDLRSALARRELEAGTRGIEEIAYRLGFSVASAFHKAFRRWRGGSPAEYAKQNRGD